ncbi:MAG: hypothetical protein DMG48_02195 [Acidobacteria bacterium]|nr:MAG: hypothetical protein DMG48_02195 [Acidobacteriota bacterium]
MSKLTIKVELQGLKIEVEGSREDVPRLAQKVGEQIGSLVQPALLLEGESSRPVDSNGDDRALSEQGKTRRRRVGGGSGRRTPAEEIDLSIDPAKHGSPRQTWNGVQKSIWLLHVAGKALSSYSIEKAFNAQFRAAGPLRRQNVARDLDKEKLKGKEAPVGAEISDGTTKYFLTDAGSALAKKLIAGDDSARAAGAD